MSVDVLKSLQALPAKDRQRLQWLIAALVLTWVWLFNLAPALKTWREAPAQLLQLEAQTQSLKTMQAQAQNLQKSARLSTSEASTLLQQSATEVLGAAAKLSVEGGHVSLALNGVSAENLAQFLALARTKSHALPTEAHLQKFTPPNGSSAEKGKPSAATALWRGTLLLNLPAQ